MTSLIREDSFEVLYKENEEVGVSDTFSSPPETNATTDLYSTPQSTPAVSSADSIEFSRPSSEPNKMSVESSSSSSLSMTATLLDLTAPYAESQNDGHSESELNHRRSTEDSEEIHENESEMSDTDSEVGRRFDEIKEQSLTGMKVMLNYLQQQNQKLSGVMSSIGKPQIKSPATFLIVGFLLAFAMFLAHTLIFHQILSQTQTHHKNMTLLERKERIFFHEKHDGLRETMMHKSFEEARENLAKLDECRKDLLESQEKLQDLQWARMSSGDEAKRLKKGIQLLQEQNERLKERVEKLTLGALVLGILFVTTLCVKMNRPKGYY